MLVPQIVELSHWDEVFLFIIAVACLVKNEEKLTVGHAVGIVLAWQVIAGVVHKLFEFLF